MAFFSQSEQIKVSKNSIASPQIWIGIAMNVTDNCTLCCLNASPIAWHDTHYVFIFAFVLSFWFSFCHSIDFPNQFKASDGILLEIKVIGYLDIWYINTKITDLNKTFLGVQSFTWHQARYVSWMCTCLWLWFRLWLLVSIAHSDLS